ncbi:hypothetical protein Plhal304r1_c015g0057041 [Plasmopara halstedii]
MVLNQDSGSSSEEEVDLPCPIHVAERGSEPWFIDCHVEDHRTERAIAKYVANES